VDVQGGKIHAAEAVVCEGTPRRKAGLVRVLAQASMGGKRDKSNHSPGA
jgi:hypothetical protein